MLKDKKDTQFVKLIEILNDKRQKEKGYEVLVGFIRKYDSILNAEEKSILFKYMLKKFEILEDYAYHFNFTNQEREKIVRKFNQNPFKAIRYEQIASKVFSKEEFEYFLANNKLSIAEGCLLSIKHYEGYIKDLLDKEVVEHVINAIYNDKKRITNSFLDYFIKEIETKEIKTSQDNYDKLMSVKVMRELLS